MGPGILPETTVGKHGHGCEHGPEAPSCPVGQGLFKIDSKWTQSVSKWKSVRWSEESKFDIVVGNHGRRVLWPKEEGDLSACYQHSVQKPVFLMVAWCISAYGMGSLHVLEGTMNAERYIKVLEQHMHRSRRRLFQGRACVFQQDHAKPHTAVITTEWLHSRRVRVLN